MSYNIVNIAGYVYFQFINNLPNDNFSLDLNTYYNYAIYWNGYYYNALVGLTWSAYNDPPMYGLRPLTSNGNLINSQVNTVDELLAYPNIVIDSSGTSFFQIDENAQLTNFQNQTFLPLNFIPPPEPQPTPGGAGAGSDPYITTFSGYTFELPHLNKWWNLFTHKSSEFTINAHTHNYSSGNYFNQIKVSYGNSKAIIDYQKKKITSNNSEFKVGKTELTLKYNKKGKIINETKLFDCIVLNHPVFEEIVLLVNWRNDYFHPIFKVQPTKDCSGLLMSKSPTFLKN